MVDHQLSNINIYYVYAYINKKTSLPYYIGKGSGNRAYVSHGRVKIPKDKSKIIILNCKLSEESAFELEKTYINLLGRKDINTGILLNMTDGGENPPNHSGKKRTQWHIQRIIESKTGIPRSEEVKIKLSIGSKEAAKRRKEAGLHNGVIAGSKRGPYKRKEK